MLPVNKNHAQYSLNNNRTSALEIEKERFGQDCCFCRLGLMTSSRFLDVAKRGGGGVCLE